MSSSSVTGGLVKGGPVTKEGKEVVKWNATSHGIRSPAPVVPGIERTEDWEEHREGVLESLQPEGHLEFVLAERVALLSWRLHRVIRYETESISLLQEKAEDDLAKERRFESGPDTPRLYAATPRATNKITSSSSASSRWKTRRSSPPLKLT
jgi:hypothetical protein